MENRVLGRSIAILHRREQKYMIQTMKEYGIGYSSYNFLFYLSAYPGSSQKEMCENMAVDEAIAVRTMKKLQEQGLIERKKSEEDARSYAIYPVSYTHLWKPYNSSQTHIHIGEQSKEKSPTAK